MTRGPMTASDIEGWLEAIAQAAATGELTRFVLENQDGEPEAFALIFVPSDLPDTGRMKLFARIVREFFPCGHGRGR